MKILLLSHIYPPATDGGSKIIAKIGDQLAKYHNEILVLTTDCHTTDDFVTPNRQPFTSQNNIIRLPVYRLHRRLPKPIFKITPFIKTLLIIFKFKPDIIIAGPFPTFINMYALFLKYLLKAKLILVPCFHQYDRDFNRPHLLFCLKHADLVCTLTKYESTIIKAKTFVMHAGIDKSLLLSSSSKKIHKNQIVFLGNFSAHKGVELLVNAFARLDKNTTLLLAGQRTLYWPTIQKVIDSQPASIKKRISVHLENYDDTQLKSYLDSASLLVLPSIHESFGLVLIESMARAVPVIATEIAPVKELINMTKGGLLFKKDDCNDLVQKITTLLTNHTLYRRLSHNGFNYVSYHYTWDTIGKHLWQEIQKWQ